MPHKDIIVVEAYGTLHEANIRKRRRIENGELVRIPCSQPGTNTIIVEHSRNPTAIADSVDAGNHNSPAPQPAGQDGPEHPSPPVLSSPAPKNTSPTGFINGNRDGFISIESTRHTLLPSKSN
jgi:hypothetical protein